VASFYNLRIVHNPEFLTAAKPFEDFMNQKEVILSGNLADTAVVRETYKKLFPEIPVVEYTDYKVTEMAKYFSNCFLAVKVTFANEMYELCTEMKCSYNQVREAALGQGLIGANHTKVPGPDGKVGYGGGCLVKESIALSSFFKEHNLACEVLNAAIAGNKSRREFDSACREVEIIDGQRTVREITI
jgi:UDPglucose 6-dehydrogenase